MDLFSYSFQLSTLDLLEVEFHIIFFLNLSKSHDSSRGLNKLTRVDSGLFLSLFYLIFLFYSLTLGWLEIRFHNFFLFFYMKLFESHNPGHKFNKLTQVNSIYFLSFLIEFFFRTHNFFLICFL